MAAPAQGGDGHCTVVLLGPKLDRHNNALGGGLHSCVYGPLESNLMVKRGLPTDLPPHYHFLHGLENRTILSIYDFIINGDEGCLVLDSVEETFSAWVAGTTERDLFTASPEAANKVRFSPMLRKVILELCNLVDCLIKHGYHPVGLNMDDLFINNMAVQGPTLKVLLSHNVIETQAMLGIGSTWTVVKDAIDHCCLFHGVELDDTSTSFKNFIGLHWDPDVLPAYPDQWKAKEKSDYLFLICGDASRHDIAIINAGVGWPRDPSDPNKRHPVMQAIVNHHKTINVHYTMSGGSYVRHCRNVLKYLNLPPSVTAQFSDREGFLRQMEVFDPMFWVSLYELIGPLGDKVN